ncbi:MAG: hypothetical protein K0R22_3373 [Sporomusa sp.]|jgi:hypothetical protein|nr:hypothetical protein [Sporomusa sp.]
MQFLNSSLTGAKPDEIDHNEALGKIRGIELDDSPYDFIFKLAKPPPQVINDVLIRPPDNMDLDELDLPAKSFVYQIALKKQEGQILYFIYPLHCRLHTGFPPPPFYISRRIYCQAFIRLGRPY